MNDINGYDLLHHVVLVLLVSKHQIFFLRLSKNLYALCCTSKRTYCQTTEDSLNDSIITSSYNTVVQQTWDGITDACSIAWFKTSFRSFADNAHVWGVCQIQLFSNAFFENGPRSLYVWLDHFYVNMRVKAQISYVWFAKNLSSAVGAHSLISLNLFIF